MYTVVEIGLLDMPGRCQLTRCKIGFLSGPWSDKKLRRTRTSMTLISEKGRRAVGSSNNTRDDLTGIAWSTLFVHLNPARGDGGSQTGSYRHE